MASVTAVMNAKGLNTLLDGSIGKVTHHNLAVAVRDGLAIIEINHKKKQIRRASSGKAIRRTWTTREGQLSKSFHRDWKKGNLYGAYGSILKRARVIEEGGTIYPKGTFLAIPTENAPKGVWPRYVPNLTYIQSRKGQPLLVEQTGKDGAFKVMYILRRSVTLKARPALARAIKATEKARVGVFQQALMDSVDGKYAK